MNKLQVIIVLIAIGMVIGLYQLPTVVVSNEDNLAESSHSFEITEDDAKAIKQLKDLLKTNQSENYINFADSLARYYLRYGFLDSAEQVTFRYLARDSSLSTLKKAGNILYASFERSQSVDEARTRAEQTGRVIKKVLELDPLDLGAKCKLAMTLVTTENPMSGISLLREVLEQDPNNREALINLGLLSIQSGQFDRAIERFQRLLELSPEDQEARLYLGVSLMEAGRQDLAKELFGQVAADALADPALVVAAQEYLESIK